MASFLADIGVFFTQSVTWLTSIMSTITASPALTVLVLAMPICGFAVGLLGRLVRL